MFLYYPLPLGRKYSATRADLRSSFRVLHHRTLFFCAHAEKPARHNIGFPANVADARDMTGAEVNPLLQFYGLSRTGTVRERLDRLMVFLGVQAE